MYAGCFSMMVPMCRQVMLLFRPSLGLAVSHFTAQHSSESSLPHPGCMQISALVVLAVGPAPCLQCACFKYELPNLITCWLFLFYLFFS